MSDWHAKGSKHENSKLTEQAVLTMRAQKRFRGDLKYWANKYNVSPTTISHVLVGDVWKYLTEGNNEPKSTS